jgi:outer membrane lipoprotein LolB
MKLIIISLALLLSSELTGCSLLNIQQDDQALENRLNLLQQWQARGKLSIVSPEDSATGYLTWKQDHKDFDLFISGPLGQGSTRLVGNNHAASLTLPGKNPVYAPSADKLVTDYLGWQFPVLDIRYWVKGQASPNYPSTEVRDSLGLLENLYQHGWEVQLSRYQRIRDTWLPGRIKIIGHDFKFIFVIKEWTIDD